MDVARNLAYCKKGGLITEHHNKLHDGVTELTSNVFIPTHVLDDPKIYRGTDVRGGKDKLKGSPSKDKGELKGDLLIR